MSGTNGNGKAKTKKPLAKGNDGRDSKGRILPGTVLNPIGARSHYTSQVRSELREILARPETEGGDTTMLHAFLEEVVRRAMEGDSVCTKLIMERIYPATLKVDMNDTTAPMTALSVFHNIGRTFAETGQMPKVVDCEVKEDKPT